MDKILNDYQRIIELLDGHRVPHVAVWNNGPAESPEWVRVEMVINDRDDHKLRADDAENRIKSLEDLLRRAGDVISHTPGEPVIQKAQILVDIVHALGKTEA